MNLYELPGLIYMNYMKSKCSDISNSFPFLFSNKMVVFRAKIHKLLVRIANRDDTV